jgi:hypothetical protein
VLQEAVGEPSKALFKNSTSAPVVGELKLPSAPAVSVQAGEAFGGVASFAKCRLKAITLDPAFFCTKAVMLLLVPVPVAVGFCRIACAAVKLVSHPVTSNSTTTPPVRLDPQVAVHAAVEEDPPELATQTDVAWVVERSLAVNVTLVHVNPCPANGVAPSGSTTVVEHPTTKAINRELAAG